MSVFPQHVRARECRVTAEIDFDGRREPAEVVAVTLRNEKGGLGEVHLACDVEHPGGIGGLRQDADGGGVAAEGAICERVYLRDTERHASNLRTSYRMRMAATTQPMNAPARPLLICIPPLVVIQPITPPIVVPADNETNILPSATCRSSNQPSIGAVIAPIGPPNIGPMTSPMAMDHGSCSSQRPMLSAAAPASVPKTAPAAMRP